MAQATDSTTLNPGAGGDVIATEDMPAGSARATSDVPTTEYKLPRSKLAVGSYGQDAGDVTHENPLPVESREQRQIEENLLLVTMDTQRFTLASRGRERVSSLFQNRGGR
jgi:hypothetical protein